MKSERLWMCGSAMFTIVASRMTISCAPAMTARARPGMNVVVGARVRPRAALESWGIHALDYPPDVEGITWLRSARPVSK